MSFKCAPIYGLMFRILTRFHALYFGASCIHRNSIVWRRVNLARFPYWPEKRTRRISRYSYLMKTLISSEYGLTISGHVTVLRQWLSEKNTDYIIKFVSPYRVSLCRQPTISIFIFLPLHINKFLIRYNTLFRLCFYPTPNTAMKNLKLSESFKLI